MRTRKSGKPKINVYNYCYYKLHRKGSYNLLYNYDKPLSATHAVTADGTATPGSSK